MTRVLFVAAGGALGAVFRYVLTVAIDQAVPTLFPVGTFAINLGGSFAMGLLYELSVRLALSAQVRMLAGAGFLGAFTTFSTLAFEVNTLARGRTPVAALYPLASIVGGVALCWLGMTVGRLVTRAG